MRRHIYDHKPNCPELSEECKKIADCVNKAIQCGYVTQIHAPQKSCKMISGIYTPVVTCKIFDNESIPIGLESITNLIYHKNKVDRVVSFSTTISYAMNSGIDPVTMVIIDITVEDSMTNLECVSTSNVLGATSRSSTTLTLLPVSNSTFQCTVTIDSPIFGLQYGYVAITGHYTY
jgi:hypothetical protein